MSPLSLRAASWLSSAMKAPVVEVAPVGRRLAGVSVTRTKLPPLSTVNGNSSPELRSAGAYAGISYSHISRLASAVNGFMPGFGVGVVVGAGVGLGVGVGVAAPVVRVLPSKLPGWVESGTVGVDEVAFELNAIHLPSWLIVGRRFVISTLMFVVTNPRD